MIEFDCTCVQKHHSIPTEVIEVSDHAILKVPEILKDYHRIFLVADENTYEVAGRQVEALLKESDYTQAEHLYQYALSDAYLLRR